MLLVLLTLAAAGQKAHRSWLTIKPIKEKPQASPHLYREIDHVHDTNYLIIGKINVTGNKKTKTAIVLRELRLQPGDTIYSDDLTAFLEEKRQQLLNSSLFLTVSIYTSHTTTHATDLNVDVFERQYFLAIPVLSLADRNFNVWWVDEHHRLDRLNYGLKVYQNNMTGKNDRLALTIQHGYTRRYSLEYQLPYFDKDLKQGLGIFISYSHNREVNFKDSANKQVYLKLDNFVKQEFSFGLNYTYKKAIRLKHKVSLTYNVFKVKDTVLERNPHFFPNDKPTQKYLELSYNFNYTGADVWAYPLRGFNINAGVVRRGFGLLGKIDETIFSLDAAKYWTFFPKTYGEMEFLGKAHFPINQPYFLVQSMGYYENYLRGMEYFVLESDRFGILRNTLKREALAFQVHTSLLPKQFSTIPVHIYVKAYSDLGYSYRANQGSSMLDNKLLYTYGFGLDIVTFYDALLRVEYSINQLGQKGLFLHFKSTF
jgi:outer membrane protein assembly factor BamA